MTLDTVMSLVETSRLQGGVLGDVIDGIRVNQAIVAEYEKFLWGFQYPEAFWIWVLGGQDRKGEEYPLGVVLRETTDAEVDRRIAEFSALMTDQVVSRMNLHVKAPTLIPSPIRWGLHFIGTNRAHAGVLKKERHGIWAVRSLYRRYKDYAKHLDSMWADYKLSTDTQLPLLEMEEPIHWPPSPKYCFPWKRLPLWRPWLLDVSPTKRDWIEQQPAVLALQVRAIGYMGLVMANAAQLVRREEAADSGEKLL
jgi:hypothetical protein